MKVKCNNWHKLSKLIDDKMLWYILGIADKIVVEYDYDVKLNSINCMLKKLQDQEKEIAERRQYSFDFYRNNVLVIERAHEYSDTIIFINWIDKNYEEED